MAGCLWIIPAFGEPPALARDLHTSQSLTDSDREQLREYVAGWAELLETGTPGERSEARDALFAPLEHDTVTVAFRLAYADALRDRLERWVAPGGDLRLAGLGATLAGEVGTRAMLRVLEDALEDDRPAVRFAASVGFSRLLPSADATLGARAVPDVIAIISEALGKEQDPRVVEGLVRALHAGGRLGDRDLALESLRSMCSGVSRVCQRLVRDGSRPHEAGDWATALLRGVYTAQDATQEQIQTANVDRAFAIEAARMAGHVIGYTAERLDRIVEAEGPDGEASLLRRLSGQAEKLLVLADGSINQRSMSGGRLERAVERAVDAKNAAAFREEADRYIGAEGVLAKPPYNARPGDFVG